MKNENNRRLFLKKVAMGGLATTIPGPTTFLASNSKKIDEQNTDNSKSRKSNSGHKYNETYSGKNLSRVAFPIGGIGAGMFCMEGTGAISHMSIRNTPDIFNEPSLYAAIKIINVENGVKVLEGPVPDWKVFGKSGSGNGDVGSTYGLPRFKEVEFAAKFPFGNVSLRDNDIPLKINIKGWSPFIPGDADNSSLPVGCFEYTFENENRKAIDAIFSFNSKNFVGTEKTALNRIKAITNGFVLEQAGTDDRPDFESHFAVYTDSDDTVVDYCWFRGKWRDPITMSWNSVSEGEIVSRQPVEKDAPGASLFVPFSLNPGEKKTIRLMFAWYTPITNLRFGEATPDEKKDCNPEEGCCSGPKDLDFKNGETNSSPYHSPWYSSRFKDIHEVIKYWEKNYTYLFKTSKLFSESFHNSTLPPEVIEAVSANFTIMKSPTVLRQYDGRLWGWEGCRDSAGCCAGSCTHVWNYAQAIPHLFPILERSLRNTEFCENQSKAGHQGFRANLPISPLKHGFYAAADGQLGGIMKVYRDWRISGDNKWLEKIYPMVKVSMDYCIDTWDPRSMGIVEEPHHNTYDIEFWGPDGMCTSFYLGALKSMIEMSAFLKKDASKYENLFQRGKRYMETELFNGEYFIQHIKYKGLNAQDPASASSLGGEYSPEAIVLLEKEGPKYQYGTGCLSDGVLGAWIGHMCGIHDFIDSEKTISHLMSVYRYNFKEDLSKHANPQRPSYALGNEGGLLLCTWPKGGKLSLPFVYSDEVWTGIEYQVASHLMLMGKVKEGLEIVRYCRNRYDGSVRNPFNEYECGHWYARAMSSYGLLEGLTGVRYDAVEKVLYIDSKIGDFTSFISTATGFGNVSLKSGKPVLKVVYGEIEVTKVIVSGKVVKV